MMVKHVLDLKKSFQNSTFSKLQKYIDILKDFVAQFVITV
jgi:hypothetical protein